MVLVDMGSEEFNPKIALEWFRSYLCNRSQFVMYRETDLQAVLKHSQCILVADYTTVYISGIN